MEMIERRALLLLTGALCWALCVLLCDWLVNRGNRPLGILVASLGFCALYSALALWFVTAFRWSWSWWL